MTYRSKCSSGGMGGMTSGDPFLETEDRSLDYGQESTHTYPSAFGPEEDIGRTIDFVDAGEMSEQGRDPRMSMRRNAMDKTAADLMYVFPTNEASLAFQHEVNPYLNPPDPSDPDGIGEYYGSAVDGEEPKTAHVFVVYDDDVVKISEMAAKHGGSIVKEAASVDDRDPEIKDGQKVIHTPSDRPGKVTTMNAHVCTVEFSDGQNPEIQQVWVSDLVPASSKEASKKKKDVRAILRGLTASARKETLPKRLANAADAAFMQVYLPSLPFSDVKDTLFKEHRGSMLDLVGKLRSEGKTLDQAGLPAIVANSLFVDTLKDKYWERFALDQEASFESHRDPRNLPERVMRQTIDKLEEKGKSNSLSTEQEAELMKLLEEEEEHRGHDDTKNHVVTSESKPISIQQIAGWIMSKYPQTKRFFDKITKESIEDALMFLGEDENLELSEEDESELDRWDELIHPWEDPDQEGLPAGIIDENDRPNKTSIKKVAAATMYDRFFDGNGNLLAEGAPEELVFEFGDEEEADEFVNYASAVLGLETSQEDNVVSILESVEEDILQQLMDSAISIGGKLLKGPGPNLSTTGNKKLAGPWLPGSTLKYEFGDDEEKDEFLNYIEISFKDKGISTKDIGQYSVVFVEGVEDESIKDEIAHMARSIGGKPSNYHLSTLQINRADVSEPIETNVKFDEEQGSPWDNDSIIELFDSDDAESEAGEKLRKLFSVDPSMGEVREKDSPEDMPLDLFADETMSGPDTRDLNSLDEMSTELPLDKKPDYEGNFSVGAIKTAAQDIEMNLFDGESFGEAEHYLGSLVAENNTVARPRLLASKSELISAAADSFRKIMKSLKGGYAIEQVSLNHIRSNVVEENTGLMVTGSVEFHVILASHIHRRRKAMELIIPVIAGKPQQDGAYFQSTAGEKIPIEKNAIDAHMTIRRGSIRSGKHPTRVERSFIHEG